MMYQEIEEKAKAAQKETNPGAQLKALLDWGETLLNHCVGFLFGEFKKFQKIIEPFERGLMIKRTLFISLITILALSGCTKGPSPNLCPTVCDGLVDLL